MPESYTIRVKGLDETLKLLGKVDKDLRKEATNVLKEHVLIIKRAAQTRMGQTPGVRRSSYPLTKTAIVHKATTRSAGVGINRASKKGRNAAIFPAEFGAFTQFVPYGYAQPNWAKKPGRYLSQGAMRRRTFPVWRGNQHKIRGKSGPGWIVMPTIRKELPKIEHSLIIDLRVVFDKAAARAGVPRG